MTDVSITAEDRERLAKSKFSEWFDEFFDKKFEDAIKRHGTSSTPKTATTDQQQQQPQSDGQPQPKRRSLLETCLSDTFGF
jgi:hypothetical protein